MNTKKAQYRYLITNITFKLEFDMKHLNCFSNTWQTNMRARSVSRVAILYEYFSMRFFIGDKLLLYNGTTDYLQPRIYKKILCPFIISNFSLVFNLELKLDIFELKMYKINKHNREFWTDSINNENHFVNVCQ